MSFQKVCLNLQPIWVPSGTRIGMHEECFFSHNQKSLETSNLLKNNELCNTFILYFQSFSCFFTRDPYYLAILSDIISMISDVFIEPVLADSMFNS